MMKGSRPQMDVSGNGGSGRVNVVAGSIVDLLTGIVAADGGSGKHCGPSDCIDLEATSGPVNIANTIRASTPGGECEAGYIWARLRRSMDGANLARRNRASDGRPRYPRFVHAVRQDR